MRLSSDSPPSGRWCRHLGPAPTVHGDLLLPSPIPGQWRDDHAISAVKPERRPLCPVSRGPVQCL